MDSGEIAILIEKTARAVYDERGPKAVHPGQWAVLRYLSQAPHAERTVGGVAQFLSVTHAPASRAVAALARKHLVRIETDPNDRRIRRINLAPEGRNILALDPVRRLSTVIGDLPEKDREALARLMETLYAGLSGPTQDE